MALAWRWLDVDCGDPTATARFWGGVFGVEPKHEGGSCADDPPEWTVQPPDSSVTLLFLSVPEPKTVKNRLHFDLTPDPGQRDAEVERLLALGATRVDVGQTGEESWVVLADPEGNELCVLSGADASA